MSKSDAQNSDPYLLARGVVPSTRLNLQQYVWREALGYVIHPRIPLRSPTLRIADVATGTGQWLCLLSEQLPPSCELVGFDLSADQFPPKTHWPSNVRFQAQDAKQTPPPELQGTFDIVHIRLVQLAIMDNDPTPILKHCMSLLKPGGYLQWDEYDPVDQILHDPDNSGKPGLEALASYSSMMAMPTWIATLPSIMDKSGLRTVSVDRCREKPWQRTMVQETGLIAVDEMIGRLRGMGSNEQADKLSGINKQALEDVRQGAYISAPFQVVVAQSSE